MALFPFESLNIINCHVVADISVKFLSNLYFLLHMKIIIVEISKNIYLWSSLREFVFWWPRCVARSRPPLGDGGPLDARLRWTRDCWTEDSEPRTQNRTEVNWTEMNWTLPVHRVPFCNRVLPLGPRAGISFDRS